MAEFDPTPTTGATRDFVAPKDKKVSSKGHQRLSIAHQVIQDVKKINEHAGNQIEALKATKGNSAYRGSILRDSVDDTSHWKFKSDAAKVLATKYPEAFFVAKAELMGAVDVPGVTNAGAGGTCWDQAHLAYYFLRIKAAGQLISVVSSPIDHAFTLIGDQAAEPHNEIAVCDAWPTKATACLWDEHFCHQADIPVARSVVADGGGKADDGTDAKEAIKANLTLTDAAKAFIQTTLTDEEVNRHIASGQERGPDGKPKRAFAETVRPDQPVYHHWGNVTTTRSGDEIRSIDPESAGGRYMTEGQINDAAGPAVVPPVVAPPPPAEVADPDVEPPVAPAPSHPTISYRRHSKGPEVVELQTKLVELGELKNSDDGSPIAYTSGTFDQATKFAVQRYQRKHRDSAGKQLRPDGIVGKLTWGALDAS